MASNDRWIGSVLALSLLLLASALSACSSNANANANAADHGRAYTEFQPPRQRVPDAQAAIRIADEISHREYQADDDKYKGAYVRPHWHVALKGDLWHLWATNDPDEKCAHYPLDWRCHASGFNISVSDGRTSEVAYIGCIDYCPTDEELKRDEALTASVKHANQ